MDPYYSYDIDQMLQRIIDAADSNEENRGPNSYLLPVKDDEMSSRFQVGDMLIVDPDEIVHTGDFAIVSINDDVLFRRYIETDDMIRLEPLNSLCISNCFRLDDKVAFEIHGKVVGLKPRL